MRCILAVLAVLSFAHVASTQSPCGVTPAVEQIGEGTSGVAGRPRIMALGAPIVGLPSLQLAVTDGPSNGKGVLLIGTELMPLELPEVGGTIYPGGNLRSISFTLNARGASKPVKPNEVTLPHLCGVEWIVQAALEDDRLPGGYALTGALRVTFGGPPGGAPVVTPPASPTAAHSVVLTGFGTQPGSTIVVEGGAEVAEGITALDSSFSLAVDLEPNANNVLFVTETTALGVPGPPATLSVIQDGTIPEVFIDFPVDGAVLSSPTTNVSGRVSDTLSGFDGLTVEVNGQPAVVDIGIGTNGTFDLPGFVLDEALTTITAVATDAVGNESVVSIQASFEAPAGAALALIETPEVLEAPVNTALDGPVVVRVTDTLGSPLPNKLVNLRVARSDGLLSAAEPLGDGRDGLTQFLQVFTNGDGLARAWWTLGSDAGCGNNRLEISSQDISGIVYVCASALPGGAAQVNVSSGNGQVGRVGSPALEPLRAWVSDSCNGVSGVPVTFTVLSGGGLLSGGGSVNVPQITIPTAETGHVQVAFQIGATAGNHVVQADFDGNPGQPAVFVVRGIVAESEATSLRGVVHDNSGQPLEGATCELSLLGHPAIVDVTDASGRFAFEDLPQAGLSALLVDGSTVTSAGGRLLPTGVRFPDLHFEPYLVAEATNTLRAPVLLPRLLATNVAVFDTTAGPPPEDADDLVLEVDGIDGLKMFVSMQTTITLPDGTVVGPDDPGTVELSLDQVHHDNVPMPMPDGAAPPFAWTLQPGGAHFDPPIRIEYPNMSGLPPGALSNFLSFDHATGRFEIVATGQVSPDGASILSDPGDGLAISGWGCNCPPYSVTADCKHCEPRSDCECGVSGTPSALVPDCWLFTPIGISVPWVPSFTPGAVCFQNDSKTGPCDLHDKCWGTCAPGGNLSAHQASCDSQFLDGMYAECGSLLPGNPIGWAQCRATAYIYYGVVSLDPIGAYEAAQQELQDDGCCDGSDAEKTVPPGTTPRDPPYEDQDGDLLPDDWEVLNDLDPRDASDGMMDHDLDGLTNIEEFLFSTDPHIADSDDDGQSDLQEILAVMPPKPVALDDDWVITAAGQSIEVSSQGTFRLGNIAAADQFGPNGPGSAPDFLSDEPIRVTGSTVRDGTDYFLFSSPFQFAQGESFSLTDLIITEQAPLYPASIAIDVDDPVLTSLGETANATTTATLPDGSIVDVTPAMTWTSYRTSNPSVATVDQDGRVTATGPGTAFLTAVNEGAASVATISVSPGDPGTQVVGSVITETGMPVVAAQVSIPTFGLSTTTDTLGGFQFLGVPSGLGPFLVTATYEDGGQAFFGSSGVTIPLPGLITDAGLITLVDQLTVGYYDLTLDGGDPDQAPPILAAGQLAVDVGPLASADLSSFDVLFIQNPDNDGYAAPFLSSLSELTQFVIDGGVLVFHDRHVDTAESILPGRPGVIVRDFSDDTNIDVVSQATSVTSGPGGVVDDATLDGGDSSSHGFVVEGSIPPDGLGILSRTDPAELVLYCYGHGEGKVVYSSMPLDYYLNGSGPSIVSAGFREVYAPNVIQFAAELAAQQVAP